MAGAPSVTDSELELHFGAYEEIFRAVLARLPIDDAGRADRLKKARAFLRDNVHHADDFISQLSGLARVLGVKEAALGSFIGANFLKALQMVRKRSAAAAQPAPGGQSGGPAQPAARKYANILAEIADRFPPIATGGHFVPLEDGFLKFVSPAGEVLPASMGAGAPQAEAAAPAAGSSPPEASGAAVADTAATPTIPEPKKPAAAPAARAPEKSIIKEILERFGSVLDIHGKLEPSTGLEGGGSDDSDADTDEDDELEGEAQASEEAASGSSSAKSGGAISSARATPTVREKSIIAEILEKFGSHLDVHEKLVPSSGIEPGDDDDGSSEQDDEADEQMDAAERNNGGARATSQAAGAYFPPLPLDFEAYMATLRRVQEFQTTGRDAEYRQWVTGAATPSEKAMVGLRNLEARSKGTAIDWDTQYASLSAHMDGVSPEQLGDLHHRLRGFAQVHQLIGRVKAGLQGKPQPFVSAMRAIWPNLLLLLNEDTDLAGYQAEFRIALLAIPDPNARGQVEKFLQPVFERLAGIYESIKS